MPSRDAVEFDVTEAAGLVPPAIIAARCSCPMIRQARIGWSCSCPAAVSRGATMTSN
jgi:hypothetical protein